MWILEIMAEEGLSQEVSKGRSRKKYFFRRAEQFVVFSRCLKLSSWTTNKNDIFLIGSSMIIFGNTYLNKNQNRLSYCRKEQTEQMFTN